MTILNISAILIAMIVEMELAAMAIGERIHFFRTMRGMTQKYLGMLLGFPDKSADVRLAQYETGARTPKADLTASLTNTLGVSPLALSVPDIDSCLGLLPCSKPGRSARRTMTAGTTDTRNFPAHRARSSQSHRA